MNNMRRRYSFLGTGKYTGNTLESWCGSGTDILVATQVANWGLPLAAIADIRKDPEMISGVMSPTLMGYS